ncbi:hypothetical protein GGR58DRAFT_26154 [Xylaria digitata]|nr:hypothetical protein GGR58DRAFT_26154 [Xylaria digitata]
MSSTSSSDPILFYDIASGPPVHPYSPNPWKTRYALNFKGAKFVTKWVELPDIPATRQSLGLDAVRFYSDGEPYATLPIIKDLSTNTIIGDSFDIAVYLDKQYPNGPLLFRYPIGLYEAFNTHINSIFPTGGMLFSEGLPLNPATAEQTKAKFCKQWGKSSWDEFIVRGEERRKVLDAFQVALGEVAKYFRFSDGPFIGGQEPDYADIIIGGWLMMLSQVVSEWEEIRTWHGGVWGKLHDGLEPYRGTW